MPAITRSEHSTQLIFIVGFSHSGTTLLNVLLGNHSQIFGVGELNHLFQDSPTRLCGCGALLRDCIFWDRVACEVSGVLNVPKNDFWEKGDFVRLNRGSAINAILMKASMHLGNVTFSRFVQAVNPLVVQHQQKAVNHWVVCDVAAKVAGVRYIADSTGNTYRLWSLYRLRPKYMKIIYLVRDGRNVVASTKKSGRPMEELARNWKHANRSISSVLRSIPEASQYRLRYEDLCRNPTSWLAALCEFIGVEPERSMEELARRVYHEIPGNHPMLYGREQSIRIRDNWRDELSTSDINVFERISGRMNRQYGYE